MEGEKEFFRKRFFGGFNREDVIKYIAKIANERNEALAAQEKAEKELNEARTAQEKAEKELDETRTAKDKAENELKEVRATQYNAKKELGEALAAQEKAENDAKALTEEVKKMCEGNKSNIVEVTPEEKQTTARVKIKRCKQEGTHE